ncbi:hypothetical protein ACFL5V_00775 [Fibrobacterota bacterium]
MPEKIKIDNNIHSVTGVDYAAIDNIKELSRHELGEDFSISVSPEFAVKWSFHNRNWFGIDTLELVKTLCGRLKSGIELDNSIKHKNNPLSPIEYVFSLAITRRELFVNFDKRVLKNRLIDYEYLELVCNTVALDFKSCRYGLFLSNEKVFSFSFTWAD